MWDWDVEKNGLVWDAQMDRLYGIDEDHFTGAYDAWQTGLHPEDRARGAAEIQAALGGEGDFDSEFRVVWADGSVHTICALAQVLREWADDIQAPSPNEWVGTAGGISRKGFPANPANPLEHPVERNTRHMHFIAGCLLTGGQEICLGAVLQALISPIGRHEPLVQ